WDGYVMGRPKIDEIEVRFFGDINTLTANLLADTVDVALDAGQNLEQGLQIKDQWTAGTVRADPARTLSVYAQLTDPNPPIVGNLEFRRALYHGINRKEMVETLQRGLGSIADMMVGPNEPDQRQIAQ